MRSNVTIRPVIIPAQRRPDGSYNVKIRVTFQRKSRLIATQYVAGQLDITKTRPPKLRQNSLPWLRASSLVSQMYEALSELNFIILEYMTIDSVITYIRAHLGEDVASFRLDFFEYGKKCQAKMKESTAGTYEVAMIAFKKYLNRDTLDVSEISSGMISGFLEYLLDSVKESTAWEYLVKIRSIYNAAKLEYNDEDAEVLRIPRNPFTKLPKRPRPKPARTALHRDIIQQIISYNGPTKLQERRAMDIFILGFSLMGMNVADLYGSGYIRGDVLCYERQKTKDNRPDRAYIEVKIDPRIRPLVDRYRDRENKQAFGFKHLYANANSMTKSVWRGLKSWTERVGIKRFSFYSCKHSWGTIARSSACKIEKSLADECLNHAGDLPLADTYIERDWQMLWDANKTVLDIFNWPESWPEPKRTHTVKK